MDQTLADLQSARDYIAEFGIYQGAYVPNLKGLWYGQPCCTVGAAFIVVIPGYTQNKGYSTEEGKRIREMMVSIFAANRGLPPYQLNDAPGTTDKDVLDLYDRTIAWHKRRLEEHA